jgi:hypothetical protein
MCLHLLAELRGRRLIVGRIGVGKGVALLVALAQVEMKVPGADDAVAATRVTSSISNGSVEL